ncbi:nuclear transport factor 2 family protein [Novosphingobium sp. RD2P27]|uniref:Nuclear transport factor 2 family protein n=1 Tax=Novosphingobium kalidii TaxID=3230299 RepID=A0ABV2D3U0_9SPHN
MDAIHKLTAVEAIKLLKARYFRGVDTGDGALVRSVLAEDCLLDYTDCFVDPLTGYNHFPALSIVMRGRAAYSGNGLAEIGVISAHYGPNCEIEIDDASSARGIWSMTDRLIMPEGGPVRELLGHGHYHETYVRIGDDWLIKTLRIVRTRVEAFPAA